MSGEEVRTVRVVPGGPVMVKGRCVSKCPTAASWSPMASWWRSAHQALEELSAVCHQPPQARVKRKPTNTAAWIATTGRTASRCAAIRLQLLT
jgi:hypothetical protein